ncbi:YggT family protein [Conservatibacter flavescens]|uniref:YggT family protein n=1 Tax=Conservatibacter flavescens TaxID=28161 RepID=A0A2M8S3R1_9PAST|nr:YggT family protein [Conservatibacter flavescens]PJG85718.1 hypothetical protein CVP05_04975 [Conservatibacter flavescens]
MNAIQYLIFTLIGLYSFILVLRAWFQYCKVDFYNPLSQTLVKLTQPVLAPLRKVIPSKNNLDLAALIAAFILSAIKYPALTLIGGQVMPAIPQTLLIGILGVIKTFGEILFWSILIRAILSWFSRGNSPLEYTLYQITEPVLGPIRRLLPSTGMIDFSVMILGFILIFGNKLMYDFFNVLWLLA